MKDLILGGARSGKSQLAERLATQSGLEVVYIATATALDGEMQSRIKHHQRRRPTAWGLIEEPLALAATLAREASSERCLLVDCLTLWLTNLLCLEQPERLQQELDALDRVLPQLPGHIILVSNEVGLGIVPLGELSRQFQDQNGWLQQRLAGLCDRVILTVAGLPHQLKPNLNPLFE
ncbi:MAG TPA: bifunctional adenosylcobinamide kinase/adenosylcobinamide-phosphate guanylyltransferase [Motiliproteus sp.]